MKSLPNPMSRPTISRRNAMRLAVTAPLALKLGHGTGAATAAQDEEVVTGGTLVYGLSTDPPNLDPRMDTGYAAVTVKQQVYSSLVRIDENLDILPELATSWEEAEDRLSVTFHLREGVKWHDGTDFTADDVKFTFDTIMAEDSTASAKGHIATVDSVEVVDPLTVVFNLNQPDSMLLAVLQDNNCGIFSKAAVEAGQDLATEMMGTGPFKLVEREMGVALRFEKNADFWEPDQPYLDGLEFRPMSDDTSRVSALQNGQVNLIDYVPAQNHEELESNEATALHYDTDMTHMWLLFDFKTAPFDNVLVRQAAALAVDRAAILQVVFFGRGEIVTGGAIPSVLGGSDELEGSQARDVERAKELLSEAGYPDGVDITVTVTSTYAFHQRTGEIVQQTLSEAGFRVELELLEWAALQEAYITGDYQMLVQGGSFRFPHAAAIGAMVDQNYNVIANQGYDDPEMQALVEEIRQAPDQETLHELGLAIDTRILEQVPRIFPVARAQAEATTSNVHGYTHIPGGMYSGMTIRATWMEN